MCQQCQQTEGRVGGTTRFGAKQVPAPGGGPGQSQLHRTKVLLPVARFTVRTLHLGCTSPKGTGDDSGQGADPSGCSVRRWPRHGHRQKRPAAFPPPSIPHFRGSVWHAACVVGSLHLTASIPDHFVASSCISCVVANLRTSTSRCLHPFPLSFFSYVDFPFPKRSASTLAFRHRTTSTFNIVYLP